MKIITLSGVDGSGKSTQLQLLKERLEQGGKKVFYFHAIEFSLANRLARSLKSKKEFTPGSEKASVKAGRFSLCLRKLFLMIDVCRFGSLQKKLGKESYDYILSDRYFYDSVINILYLEKKPKSLWIEKYIPKPDQAFYMDISAEEIMQRERVPEQGIDYLNRKIELFEQKKDAFSLIPIDASQSQSIVTNSIIENISI